MKHSTVYIAIFLTSLSSYSQEQVNRQETIKHYEVAFNELNSMLRGSTPLNFKKAVFIVENTYWDNELNYELFNNQIFELTRLCKAVAKSRRLLYDETDKEKVTKHAAIFSVITDTLPINYNRVIINHSPFTYDFEDFFGYKDWSKMFVIKLMNTKKGNCHSLPYLYKILAEEMGEQAYLSLAPNHIYIKLRNKKNGWYNTELTSGIFPIDAWIKSSGFIHMNAIRNGIFMDTLGQKQSIALCLMDLAQGYERKNEVGNGEFILKACETALTYYPNFINALLIKVRTQEKMLFAQMEAAKVESITELFVSFSDAEKMVSDMEQSYIKIHQLGYRKMPEQMYLDWLTSLEKNKEKYQNKKIINFTPNTQ